MAKACSHNLLVTVYDKICLTFDIRYLYIIQTNNTNNYIHGFPDVSSRTLSIILPPVLFQMWKNATFVVVHISLLVQVDVLLQQVENVATCFFSFLNERVKVELLLCWYSSALFEYINCRYCVFIAYKDYQYYTLHIYS